MTNLFIYIVFGVIVAFDVFLVTTKRRTISSVFRNWYKKPLIPFMVGGVFLGHFWLYQFNPISDTVSIIIFLVLAVLYLVWYIVCQFRSSKVYEFFCKFFPVPLFIGSIVGSCWK